MKPKVFSSHAVALISIITLQQSHAGTIWDGGGSANTNINFADNWDGTSPGVVNALNGTTAAIFGTGGSVATMNVAGAFTSLTFNRDDAAGFTVNGTANLSVSASGSGATANLSVSNTAGNGVATISAPLRVNTDAGGTRLLVIDNRETGSIGESLVISGGIAATTPANGYGLRFGGSGSTRITGTLSNVGTTNIQQASIAGQPFSGTVTIAGSQALPSVNVQIGSTGGSVDGQVGSTARIIMGDSTADVQSWAGTSVLQAATVQVRSTATLSGGVSISNGASNGSSGGTLEVSGNLSATTLAIGGAAYSGVLKVSGNATFSGALTSGATVGSKIVGGGASTGTLTLASGTVGSAVAIGGGGTNENNIALVKSSTGTLTVSSAGNTYTGGTTLVDGGASGSFGIALGANNALGTGPLAIGTAATGANGARLRMAGFNQTVSTLSSGATTNARVIENFGAANSVLTVNGSSSTTYAGFLRDRSSASAAATGNLGLVKDGAGTLTLSNTSNQYTGATVINGGVLEVAQLTNGGVVKSVNSTAGSGTVTMADTSGVTAGMTFVAAHLPTGFSVSTVDSGTNLTINTTSGIVSGTSTAHFGVASSLGLSTNDASNLVFGGGTLRYTGGNTITDRNFTINPGVAAKIDVANVAATLELTGGATASTGGLTKLGAGTLALAGSQLYTGDTTVSAGTLVINGDLTAATGNVSVSGTLAGNGGTVGGNTTVNSGGKLALGNGTAGSIGSETFKGNLTLAADSIFNWDLTGESTTSGFDRVIGTSGKTFDATTSAFRVVTDQSFTTSFWDAQRDWNTIFSGFGTMTGWAANTPVAVYTTLGALRTDVSVEGSFTVTGGNLSWSAVPEPSSALAGLLIGAGLLQRRRRA